MEGLLWCHGASYLYCACIEWPRGFDWRTWMLLLIRYVAVCFDSWREFHSRLVTLSCRPYHLRWGYPRAWRYEDGRRLYADLFSVLAEEVRFHRFSARCQPCLWHNYDFDGVAFVGLEMEGEFDCSEWADSYLFDEAEFADSGEVAIGLYSELHRNRDDSNYSYGI